MLIIKDRTGVDQELDPKVYTMRELNQNTAQVMDEINRSGQPAAITKHGRFVALITPLADAEIETVVLSRPGPLAREMERRSMDTESATYSSDEVLERWRNRHSQ